MEYSGYSQLNPQWTKFVASHPELGDLDRVGIVERCRIFGEVEAKILPRQVLKDMFTIAVRDGHEISMRSYVPASNNRSRPVLIYLHAGGFLFGDLESGDLNCRTLAARLDINVLNVGYRVAPKWPFPHGLNDSYDATEWAAANAESHLDASPTTGFFVGGISSGANFAGVIAYQARDAGLSPPITGLWSSIPVCILPQAYHLLPVDQREQLLSLEQNAENPLLTKKSLSDIQVIYGSPPEDPRISFLLNKDHRELPKRVYFQICGRDPLRDEAFLWKKLLEGHSGTKSMVHLYTGMPHGFWRFLEMKTSQEWLEDLVEGIRYLCEPEDEAKKTKLIVKGV
ncbi:AB hydrolase superfamily protein B1A11.02 [Triangularia setosa]|uniref:AB hydrolase superfamily protein B1A11.02 n=1 Tax=Triangularia setosa TaxID=2587417 RepID=A0AAN7A8W8_9PEZI|nr:AB hydrolase superfamily protein B1A11.02 [Podospora setosa]